LRPVEDARNAVAENFVAFAPSLYNLNLALLSQLSAHIFPALQRRRAQNRVAQKAYRLRKEEKINELSAKLSEMEREMERMEQSNHDLSTQISTLLQKIPKLEKENRKLKADSPLEDSPGSAPTRTTFWVSRQTIPNGMITPAGRVGVFKPGSMEDYSIIV
jgi:septal ring factor EnvC (AmiA/AmiB activator)